MTHPYDDEVDEDDDDDEQLLDFVFDGSGTVRAPHQQTATRPRVEVLRQTVEAYRAGDVPISAVQDVLTGLEKSVGDVIQDCGKLMQSDPSRQDFFAQNLIVYQNAFEAVQRMLTACVEKRMDWMQQGLTALEGAVDEINALVAYEDEQKK